MATSPPYLTDPSQIYVNTPMHSMPMAPSIPNRSKSRLLDIFKLLIGLLIALILGAILAVLIVVPRTSNAIDSRESNEKIAKLQRELNENLTRLQREQELLIEKQRQEHRSEDRLIEEQRRQEDRLVEEQHRQEDINRTIAQTKQQFEIESQRLQLLLDEQQLNEQHRKEDFSRHNDDLLSDFIEQTLLTNEPLNMSIIEIKVNSLIRQFDPLHKSLLINSLYKNNLLNNDNKSSSTLDLQGANLNEIDLDGIDDTSNQIDLWLNYNKLALPATNLINTSFEQLYLNEANFSYSNLMGSSFRWSKVSQSNFYRSILSLSNFYYTNLSQSNLSYTKITHASFQNANLTQASLTHANLSSTNFQSVIAIQTDFSRAEISNADFEYADISQANMNEITIRSGDFYMTKAIKTNFTNAYMPGCSFQWADLTNATFKQAFLAGSNFANTNVQNVDFSRAFLSGANITQGQLDVVLSIAQAILPDGSLGKNKNLIQNGHPQCTQINQTITDWSQYNNNNNTVVISEDQTGIDCIFQANVINATLQQTIDISRYEPLIINGQGTVSIEMEDKTINSTYPSVYMNLQFFDINNNQINGEISSLNITSLTLLPKFSGSVLCPANTVKIQVKVVFTQVNASVDNIYLTIQ